MVDADRRAPNFSPHSATLGLDMRKLRPLALRAYAIYNSKAFGIIIVIAFIITWLIYPSWGIDRSPDNEIAHYGSLREFIGQ
jgi:hypothetical protein